MSFQPSLHPTPRAAARGVFSGDVGMWPDSTSPSTNYVPQNPETHHKTNAQKFLEARLERFRGGAINRVEQVSFTLDNELVGPQGEGLAHILVNGLGKLSDLIVFGRNDVTTGRAHEGLREQLFRECCTGLVAQHAGLEEEQAPATPFGSETAGYANGNDPAEQATGTDFNEPLHVLEARGANARLQKPGFFAFLLLLRKQMRDEAKTPLAARKKRNFFSVVDIFARIRKDSKNQNGSGSSIFGDFFGDAHHFATVFQSVFTGLEAEDFFTPGGFLPDPVDKRANGVPGIAGSIQQDMNELPLEYAGPYKVAHAAQWAKNATEYAVVIRDLNVVQHKFAVLKTIEALLGPERALVRRDIWRNPPQAPTCLPVCLRNA